MTDVRKLIFGVVAFIAFAALVAMPRPAAAAATGEFHIQVSPSPLVTTVKPGTTTTVELNVRNNGSETEDLKISPRAFKIDDKSRDLQLTDDQVPEIANWITFSSPTFSVQSGKVTTLRITYTVPKETGFSYAIAFVIARTNQPEQKVGNTIKASVAIFSLINVDRPGAVRSLEITKFASKKGLYEYLPAEFEIDFKNTGNSIVQPAGTLFIQRGSNDATPIATLDVNKAGGYILPGVTRTITIKWDNGFQVIAQKPQPDGKTKDELQWNWNQLGYIRFGKYTAKLVAIYDDGYRDVPLTAETTFWVTPWLLLLGILAVVLLVLAGVWTIIRGIIKTSRTIGRKKMRL